MAVMASDCPSHHWHFHSWRLSLPTPQPSRRHHTQSLLGPSFHHLRTYHVLESHPEQVTYLSSRDDDQRHAVGSHSTLALRLYLVAYHSSSSSRFWVLDHLCSNLSQSFHFCWITEIWSLNLYVCFHLLVGSHYCVMRFAYALYMRQQKILFFSPACTLSFSSLL